MRRIVFRQPFDFKSAKSVKSAAKTIIRFGLSAENCACQSPGVQMADFLPLAAGSEPGVQILPACGAPGLAAPGTTNDGPPAGAGIAGVPSGLMMPASLNT